MIVKISLKFITNYSTIVYYVDISKDFWQETNLRPNCELLLCLKVNRKGITISDMGISRLIWF